MLLSLLTPALTAHFFVVVICIIAACAVVFWVLRKMTIPEPFNYVLYAVLAVVAIYFLFWLSHQV